jgi:6-pyruvoyl-tetrahydropterin synthase
MIHKGSQNPNKLHFVDFMPTAENLCKHWYNLLEPRLKEFGIAIAHVKIWETPTSTAIYTKENKLSEIMAEEILKYNNF